MNLNFGECKQYIIKIFMEFYLMMIHTCLCIYLNYITFDVHKF
jgi:hypothetical protein